MGRCALGNKGQTTLPEYVVTFFLVIAVIVAMSVYVQRALQGRIYDARNYAVNMGNAACDADCRAAAGVTNRNLPYEYEPYYAQVNSITARRTNDQSILAGQAGFSRRIVNEQSSTNSESIQLPPRVANEDIF